LPNNGGSGEGHLLLPASQRLIGAIPDTDTAAITFRGKNYAKFIRLINQLLDFNSSR